MQLSARWKDVIGATVEEAATFDIPSWLSRAFLDAIGEGKNCLQPIIFYHHFCKSYLGDRDLSYKLGY
jgi:hypothetical protein